MRLILLLAALLVATGCGDDAKPPAPTPEPPLGKPPKTPKGGPPPVLPQ